MWTIAVKIALSESECFHIGGDKVNSSIVEGLERRGRHNVNRVAVSCVVLNNEGLSLFGVGEWVGGVVVLVG